MSILYLTWAYLLLITRKPWVRDRNNTNSSIFRIRDSRWPALSVLPRKACLVNKENRIVVHKHTFLKQVREVVTDACQALGLLKPGQPTAAQGPQESRSNAVGCKEGPDSGIRMSYR